VIDLKSASSDDLIRLVIAQHERIAALEATVAQLTARVGELLARLDAVRGDDPPTGRPQGMPGLKPAATQPRPPKKMRKRREQQFVRHRMAPTTRVIHAVAQCPTCGLALTGGSVKRRREVIEVPLVPAVVTEHVYVERCCPHCRTRHTPPVNLTGEVVGTQRFGVALVSLIATLREEARLPVATIQWYLQTFHALSVSVGAIVGALKRVAQAGGAAVEAIREEIRGSPVAHGDETGWREDGINGYLWVFCTPTAQYFVRGSRGGAMVDTVLGEEFAGVLVSDFYVGYQHYPGVKQKCWAHLLRDVHDLRAAHAEHADVQTWAAAVHDCYQRAVAWKDTHAETTEASRQEAERAFMRELQVIYAPYTEARVLQTGVEHADGEAPA